MTGAAVAQAGDKHFDPKGNMPSGHTLKVLAEARESLSFSDRRDYEEQERGLIAERKDLKIMADSGNVCRAPRSLQAYYNIGKPDALGDWSSRINLQFMFPR